MEIGSIIPYCDKHDRSYNSLYLLEDVHTKKLLCDSNKGEKSTSRRINNQRRLKHPPFYLLFIRHSHYLNVCHIRRDLLNSIYYNVMFGLNGKSMKRQARHC